MDDSRSRRWPGLLVAAAACALTLLMLELLVRAFLPVTDFPVAAYEEGLGIHAAPDQTGTWVVGGAGQVRGAYQINNAGWNSMHDYTADRPDGTLRVAVIGDSFVEALEVDVGEAFPALLERRLASGEACPGYQTVEVYSFGFQGAPMSQYLNVMRHVAERYQPDVYVISIVHNDFEPSLTDQAPHPHFLSLRPDGEGGYDEVIPVPYEPSRLRRLLIRSALVRYVYGNLKLPDLMPDLRSVFARERAGQSGSAASHAVGSPGAAAPAAGDAPVLVGMVVYVFGEYRSVAEASDGDLLLVLDADREAIYNGRQMSSEALRYLQIVDHAAQATGVDYVDLWGAFSQDYRVAGEPFNSQVDYHWNERGHEVVSDVVYAWMVENGCRISGNEPGAAGGGIGE